MDKHNKATGSCTSCEDAATRAETTDVRVLAIPSKVVITSRPARIGDTDSEEFVMFLGSFSTTEYRGCWKHAVDSRECGHDVYLIVTYAGVDQYISAIRECAIGCGIAALIAAIATEGAGGVIATAFLECVYQCVKARIGDLISKSNYDLEVVGTGCSDWSGH